jgi:undecaprenyl diphosphate synthase
MQTLLGHKRGYEVAKELLPVFSKYGIEYVTYYMFSVENWNRTEEEVGYLMNLFRDFFSSSVDYLNEHNVRVKAIGNLAMLPADILEKIRRLEEATKNNTGLTAVTAISYGGRDEIVRAAKKLAKDAVENKINIDDANEDTFASYLDTAGVPYPDAFIRTSEKRISNFLIWQAAYSEIFFLDKFWPDFNENDLKYIISEFSQRERRYGK